MMNKMLNWIFIGLIITLIISSILLGELDYFIVAIGLGILSNQEKLKEEVIEEMRRR